MLLLSMHVTSFRPSNRHNTQQGTQVSTVKVNRGCRECSCRCAQGRLYTTANHRPFISRALYMANKLTTTF